ncbi:phosphatidate cytidylyltransferase [Fulvivirgaceae bacterium BMA10]|uniref:Phosphatidate cytidylyltransferase n=1 Tax=Splendidivirga corallicola TaxID=3051826 RepID=A0ABT8KUK2_9BACT|nr:phosphatidate cytidylyltransferase [Fulvivirgaceae bacterium BMA10]
MTLSLSKYNNLTQRIITALVGLVILIGCVFWSEWTYFAIFFMICMFTQWEFYKLIGLDGMVPLKFWGTFSGSLIFSLTFFVEKNMLQPSYYLVIFPLAFSIFFIKLYKKDEKKPFTNIAFTFLGIIYVALPFALINFLAFLNGSYSYEILLGILLLHWASDTGAYFAGVSFGKTKLFERVSPKKSWEGSIGGALLALLIAYLVSLYFHDLDLWQWLSLAVIAIVAGTYGDLVESLLKRSIQIKDSGSTIPGHGGFLDRFDGLLLSLPFMVACLKIFYVTP